MKRTNIVLDERLIRTAKTRTGIKTIRELVDVALKELVRNEDIKAILALRGQIKWEGDLSRMRRSRFPAWSS